MKTLFNTRSLRMVPVVLVSVTILLYLRQRKYPFQDPSLPWDKRLDDLVGRLTIDEIVNISVAQYEHATQGVDRLGVKPYQWINECLTGIANENTTAFPQPIGMAASFSRDLILKVADAISTELRAIYNKQVKDKKYGSRGINCFSPVINIMRHPLWGRNQETYGEDPYLSGQLSMQFVHGIQGNHPRYLKATAGCKHFDAHGGPENIPVSRFSFNAKVNERDWHMTYLPQFKMCVDAGSMNIMCSYNRINGVPACANKKLLQNILRNEWGFKGFVISDASAIENIVNQHNYSNSLAEAAANSIKAGCNIELTLEVRPFVSYFDLQKSVKQMLISEDEIRQNIKKPLYIRMLQGEFDPPEMNPYATIDTSTILSQNHRHLAVQASAMSFVLMKNQNNILPLKKKLERLAIIGPFANNPGLLLGDYVPKWDSQFVSTPFNGLKALGNDVRYASGCNNAGCGEYNTIAIKEAVVGAQIVFVCLGTGKDFEREFYDRADLDLPGSQLQLLKDAAAYSQEAPLVLLLFNAGPLDITWAKLSPNVDAIIECFFPAMGAGKALYNVVANTGPYGVPAGRLPATWPAELSQVPPITDYNMKGHTYRYYAQEEIPLYPFGYGLSYSSFHYQKLTLSSTSVVVGRNVTISVQVLNMGPYDADEVTQVYMSWTKASVPVPHWTLVGFHRQRHVVNKPSTLMFTLTAEQMAVWLDSKKGFVVEPGTMVVYVGGQQPYQHTRSSSNVLKATFSVIS